MRAMTVDVKSSNGRILCCTVFRSGGKKLLAKGHVISDEDIRVLESEGMENIWVTELEEGEVGEDDAVSTVATEMGCGCYEIGIFHFLNDWCLILQVQSGASEELRSLIQRLRHAVVKDLGQVGRETQARDGKDTF